MSMIIHEEYLVTPALASHLPKFHETLDAFWLNVAQRLGQSPCDQLQCAFTTATIEIVCNIIRHAYPTDTPVGSLSLRLRCYDEYYEALLIDQGILFVMPTRRPLVDSSLDVCDLPESGFGLRLVRCSVDQLKYSRHADGTNQWLLIKRI